MTSPTGRPALQPGPRPGPGDLVAPVNWWARPRKHEEITLRIVFAGTPEPAVLSLRAVLASRHEVAAVISRADAPAGRGRRLVSSPVATLARQEGVPLLTPGSARTPEFRDQLAEFAPDAAVVVGYGAILPRPVLDVPARGWVNLHFSLLPAWRGAAPVQAAIAAGDAITGASTFRLEEGLDTGPVYGVVTEPIRPDDTTGTLLHRLATSGAGLLVVTLDGLEDGTVQAIPQPGEGISLAPKVSVDDARIDWRLPAVAIDRRVRACTPEPGAWSPSPWGRLIVGPTILTDEAGLQPGEIRVERRRVLVGTATRALQLGEVRGEGRKSMPAADWARGVRPPDGATLAGEPAGGRSRDHGPDAHLDPDRGGDTPARPDSAPDPGPAARRQGSRRTNTP